MNGISCRDGYLHLDNVILVVRTNVEEKGGRGMIYMYFIIMIIIIVIANFNWIMGV